MCTLSIHSQHDNDLQVTRRKPNPTFTTAAVHQRKLNSIADPGVDAPTEVDAPIFDKRWIRDHNVAIFQYPQEAESCRLLHTYGARVP